MRLHGRDLLIASKGMQNARSERKHYIDNLNLVIIMRDMAYKKIMTKRTMKRSYIEKSEEVIQPKKKRQIKTTRKSGNETEVDRNYDVQPKETIQLPQIQPKKKCQRKMTAKSTMMMKYSITSVKNPSLRKSARRKSWTRRLGRHCKIPLGPLM